MTLQKINAQFSSYLLNFKRPGGTSRGVLHQKETFFLQLSSGQAKGYGECALFRGLSADDRPEYEAKMAWLCDNINQPVDTLLEELREFPSIQFGLEQALLSLHSETPFVLFPSDFTAGIAGIPINGLIWMGSIDFMKSQITEKLAQGFTTLKLKIGALNFEEEYELLAALRKRFSVKDLTLRVDANGAFNEEDALEKLKRLSDLDLHSIEQPVKAGQRELMRRLCEESPLAIALDEELIGVFKAEDKANLLRDIKPQYIILKPSLVGGMKGTDEWIHLAEGMEIGWWITSALESNIGLNAIAQYTYPKHAPLVQGLGTGGVFSNNIVSPLFIKEGALCLNPKKEWNTACLK
ncbi:o-succinylbenzoate synthase [Flavobacteriaceae bacterium F08102]|nr:o-succinylbenzoate synthase [Flavobacteriaceae bacterium F08102]